MLRRSALLSSCLHEPRTPQYTTTAARCGAVLAAASTALTYACAPRLSGRSGRRSAFGPKVVPVRPLFGALPALFEVKDGKARDKVKEITVC